MKQPRKIKKNSEIKYYSNGNIRQEILTYSNNFKLEVEYKDIEGAFNTKLWHKNGLPMLERKFFNSLKHGKCVDWLSNGQKFSEETYVNGVLTESWYLTEEKSEDESLRHEFRRIKEKIDVLEGIYLNLDSGLNNINFYHRIIDFPNKNKYPINYQIYLEEIGEINMGHDGYKIVDIHKPVPFFEDEGIDNYGFACTCGYVPETPDESMFIAMKDGSPDLEIKAKDYMVVASDCDLGTYGFYIGKVPYQFVFSEGSGQCEDFLDWLKKILNNDLYSNLYDLNTKLGSDFF